jgi:hypothetical protein
MTDKKYFLSQNDLAIIKEALEHKWKDYRPQGDETSLYERVIDWIKK